jgi:hypothetical protein
MPGLLQESWALVLGAVLLLLAVLLPATPCCSAA